MPGMNGIEACRTLQAKGLNCDVIMLTLYEDHFAEAMRAGARGYLPKEINREELVATIRQVYSQRSLPQQEDPSPSFDTVDLVILAPAETSQINLVDMFFTQSFLDSDFFSNPAGNKSDPFRMTTCILVLCIDTTC